MSHQQPIRMLYLSYLFASVTCLDSSIYSFIFLFAEAIFDCFIINIKCVCIEKGRCVVVHQLLKSEFKSTKELFSVTHLGPAL